MRTTSLLVLLILLFVPPVLAGEIYGSIEVNGKPVGPGVEVAIECNGTTRPTKTDEIGSYRLYSKEKGKCTLTVKFGNEPFPSIEVYSYENTVRYDLVLEVSNGRYSLRRR
jgi:hypothetical protein